VRRVFVSERRAVDSERLVKGGAYTRVWTSNNRQLGHSDKGPPEQKLTGLNEPGQCSPGKFDNVSRDVPVLAGESSSIPAELQLQKEHGFSAIETSTEGMYGAQFHPEEWVLSVESEQKLKRGGADGSHEDPGVLALSGKCDPSSGTQQLLAPPKLLNNIEVREAGGVASGSTRIYESVEVHSGWCGSGTPRSRSESGCVVGQRLGANGSGTVLAGRVSCFGPQSASPTGNLMCSNSSENATGRVGSVARLEVRAAVHSEFDTLEKSVESCQPKGRAESEVVEIQGERLDSDGSKAAGEQMRVSCFMSQSDRLVGEQLGNLGSNGSKAALAGRMRMSCFALQVARPDNFRSNGFFQSGSDSVERSSTENTGSVEMSRVNENEQTEQLVKRGTRLAGSPSDVDGTGTVQVGAENSGLPVGATDPTVGMSGVDPFSLTLRTSDSNGEGRPAGEQSVGARQTVRAEVYSEQGFDSPNGQVGSEEYQCMDFEQLNEQPEIHTNPEQLTEQSELSKASEQTVGQVGISPTAGEQQGSLASESNDLVRRELGGSTFASQQEVAVCCPGEDCPLRAVNMAMGTPGCSFTEIAGNDFSCSSYGLDAEISRSPISEQSLAGGFSVLNYPAESVDAENDDADDDMTITRADLCPDSYGWGSQVVHSDSRWRSTDGNDGAAYTQGLRERPSRAIRRPARYEDYGTQYAPTQSYRIGSIRYVRALRRCKCSTSGLRLTPTQFIRGASRYVFSRGVG